MNKIIVTLLFLLFTAQSWAQLRHVVLNMDGVLVQGIPARNYSAFNNKDQMIQITSGGRTLHYYIYPSATYFVEYLMRSPNHRVHFVTNQSAEWAQAIIDGLKLSLKPTNKVLSGNDLVNGKIDISKIDRDISNVVLFTSFQNFIQPTQSQNEYFLGKNLFYFESYDISKAERAKVPAAVQVNFPSSEDEWFTEQNKIAFIYQILQDASKVAAPNFVTAIKKISINKSTMTRKGTLVSRYKFADQIMLFKYDSKKTKVLSCGEFNPETNSFVSDRPLSECISATQVKYVYRFDESQAKSTGCEIREIGSGAYIKDSDDEDKCFQGIRSELSYYWQGSTKVSCGAYLQDNFIKNASSDKCTHYFFVKEGGKYVVKTFFEVDGRLVTAIPEIMSLKNGEKFSASIYRKYDSVLIAQSIVQRIHQNFEKDAQEAKPNYDFMKDTRVGMSFNATYLESIQANCFLNQHDTGTSKGYLGLSTRAALEDGLLNMTLAPENSSDTKTVNRIRPKYAYVLLDVFRPDMGLNRINSNYGNVMAIFNEDVKSRSTFTAGDSLNIKATFRDIKTYYYRGKDVVINNRPSGNYFESQTWGKLCLSDVNHFLVNCFAQLSQDRIDALKATGKPVYNCKPLYHGSSAEAYNVVKGNRL